MFRQLVHWGGQAYTRRVVRNEFDAQRVKRINERPVEYAFVFSWLNRLQPSRVLDVGTGRSALPSLIRTCGFHVTAIDNIRDYWPRGMFNRHFHVIDEDIRSPQMHERFDVIVCVSVLEHIGDHRRAMRGLMQLLRPSGHLLLTHPYNERHHVENVYRLPGSYGAGAPYPCQQYTRAQLDVWMEETGASLVFQEYWQCFRDEAAWSCGDLVRPPRLAKVDEPHQLTCLVLRKADT